MHEYPLVLHLSTMRSPAHNLKLPPTLTSGMCLLSREKRQLAQRENSPAFQYSTGVAASQSGRAPPPGSTPTTPRKLAPTTPRGRMTMQGLACVAHCRDLTLFSTRICHPAARETGILLANDQRQHRNLHIQKDVLRYALCLLLYPVSAALASIFWIDSISTSSILLQRCSIPPCPMRGGGVSEAPAVLD